MSSLIEYLKIIGNARRIKKWPPPLIIPSISLLVIIIHITCQFYPEISSILSFDRLGLLILFAIEAVFYAVL